MRLIFARPGDEERGRDVRVAPPTRFARRRRRCGRRPPDRAIAGGAESPECPAWSRAAPVVPSSTMGPRSIDPGDPVPVPRDGVSRRDFDFPVPIRHTIPMRRVTNMGTGALAASRATRRELRRRTRTLMGLEALETRALLAPVANPDAYAVPESTTLQVVAPGVLANDTPDPDAPPNTGAPGARSWSRAPRTGRSRWRSTGRSSTARSPATAGRTASSTRTPTGRISATRRR